MSNSQNHHGRFGWIPEISTISPTFQNTTGQEPMDIQEAGNTSFSSRSFLDQCGIFLAAHTAYDFSKTVSQPLDTIHTIDSANENDSEDPSQYFIALQESIDNILREEKLRRDKAAAEEEKKKEEEKKTKRFQNQQNNKGFVVSTSNNACDIKEPHSNECTQIHSNVTPSQPFTSVVKKPSRTPIMLESSSPVVSSSKPSIYQESQLSKSTPLSVTLDANLDPFIRRKLEEKEWWTNFLNNDFAAVKSDPSVHTKRLRISVKKVIMLAINQLAGTSSQVESVFNKLAKLLETIYQKAQENVKDLRFYHYALTIVVESLMNCVETQVVCNPRSVWEFGQLVSRLCIFEKFEYFFECFLLHRCHFVVPLPEDLTSHQNIKNQSLPFLDRLVAYLRLWLVFLVVTQRTVPRLLFFFFC
ncbi:uncharacterized protein LOC128883411 [Hylaeus volcanicus]|uniref:uncharacterized protein LOC128883411 n=1 Tax=Hylaeus volcanicus TaxID=313075 RepID=UPI0023B79E47|nr:uncharacterized protein LOC128883411 [Hylaeus volcanicus]